MTTGPLSFSASPPQPQKQTFVDSLALGDEVSDIFLLASAQQQQAKNGPYWRLEFRDAGGLIGGKIWSPQSSAYADLSAGSMVRVTGRVTSYRDKLELSIEALHILDDAQSALLNLADFVPAGPYNPDDMLEELRFLARKTLTHKPLYRLVSALLADEEIGAGLRTAPAAKAMHHAYAGGLLEHTLSVARLSLSLAEHYPQVDEQILFTGAVCHDLGKIWELSSDLSSGFSIDYTSAGRLLGHISIAAGKLAPFVAKAGLEPESAEHLRHLILSHHGAREFGAPVLPATAEALLLHYADNIDAKMQQARTALAGVNEGESGWSAYVPSLERFLFRAAPTPRPETTEKPTGKAASAARVSAEQSLEQPLPLFSQCSLLSKE